MAIGADREKIILYHLTTCFGYKASPLFFHWPQKAERKMRKKGNNRSNNLGEERPAEEEAEEKKKTTRMWEISLNGREERRKQRKRKIRLFVFLSLLSSSSWLLLLLCSLSPVRGQLQAGGGGFLWTNIQAESGDAEATREMRKKSRFHPSKSLLVLLSLFLVLPWKK